jgi:hypothetical protein
MRGYVPKAIREKTMSMFDLYFMVLKNYPEHILYVSCSTQAERDEYILCLILNDINLDSSL